MIHYVIDNSSCAQVGDRILTIELLNADGKEIIAYGALADKKSLVNKGTFPRGLWQPVATVQLTIRRRRSQQVSFKVEGSGQVKARTGLI